MMWEDVTVEPAASFGAQRRKLLLNGITGFAEPDRVMAIMGPSGCGKTTFLDSLTGLSLSIFLYIHAFMVLEVFILKLKAFYLLLLCITISCYQG